MQQSKSRMIISIIDSVIVLSIMAVIIVSMSLKHNVLGIIFSSVIGCLLITYFILNSIFFGLKKKKKNSKKESLSRIIKIFNISTITMYLVYLSLLVNSNLKWILFSLIIIVGIANSVFIAIDICSSLTKILNVVLLVLFIIILYLIFNYNYLFYIGIVLSLFYILVNYFNNRFNNTYSYSLLVFTYIFLGIFLILILLLYN